LEADAHEIRRRAERKLGEMMAEQPKAKGGGDGSNQHQRATGVRKTLVASPTITLAQAGIDKNLAKAARKAAAIPRGTVRRDSRRRVRGDRAPPEPVRTEILDRAEAGEHFRRRRRKMWWVSSLTLAKRAGERHDNVLQKLRKARLDAGVSNALNFQDVTYTGTHADVKNMIAEGTARSILPRIEHSDFRRPEI
jgi:hypothetical protein